MFGIEFNEHVLLPISKIELVSSRSSSLAATACDGNHGSTAVHEFKNIKDVVPLHATGMFPSKTGMLAQEHTHPTGHSDGGRRSGKVKAQHQPGEGAARPPIGYHLFYP